MRPERPPRGVLRGGDRAQQGRRAENLEPPLVGSKLLGLEREEICGLVGKAAAEYAAVIGLFSDVASGVTIPASLIDSMYVQLVAAVDNELAATIADETSGHPEVVRIGDQVIELEPVGDGSVVAYINDADGRPADHVQDRPAETDDRVGAAGALGLRTRARRRWPRS